MAKGHIQDVNKSDVHIHARSGALFEISALRRKSSFGREEVAESVSLPQNSSSQKEYAARLTTEIERRGWEDESIFKIGC